MAGPQEFAVLLRGAEAHDMFDPGAIVPAPIEQHDLTARWQISEKRRVCYKNEMVNSRDSGARLLLLAGCLITGAAPILAHAQTSAKTPVEHVTAPGGKVVYYIMSLPGKDSMGNPRLVIEAGINENSSFRILLASTPSNDPKANLTDFSHLSLSPDGKMLYFQTSAWATSGAIHSLDIATKKTSYVTSGEIACVVLGGEFQGDLVVQQHRYYIQGGSYDALYLYNPPGKLIGPVSQGTDASRVCPSLGD
jgi:hypothetical protein